MAVIHKQIIEGPITLNLSVTRKHKSYKADYSVTGSIKQISSVQVLEEPASYYKTVDKLADKANDLINDELSLYLTDKIKSNLLIKLDQAAFDLATLNTLKNN